MSPESPEHEALIARGLAEQRAGRHQAAIHLFELVAKRGGASAALHCHLAGSYEALKDLQRADEAYQAAIALDPDASEAYLRAAELARRASTLARRVGQAATARDLRRGAFQYLVALAARRGERGEWPDAEAALRKALAIEPEIWSVHAELGRCLYQMYRHREAELSIREAVRLAPREAAAYYQLGTVLVRQGRASEAEAALREAAALDPSYAPAKLALAEVLRLQGRVEAAEAAYRDAAAADPEAGRGLYLLGPVYDGASPAKILERHLAWGEAAIALARSSEAERAPFANTRDPNRRLRVGYVSPDFKLHSVAYFFEPLLEHHDRAQVETFCYAEVHRPDDVTARLKSLAGHWRPTIGMDDTALRRQVREDGIDILIDLAGHTSGNRLAAFAVKPAPVTASWLGYPTTTGIATIDWRITDAIADPPGAEAHHVERLMWLDGAFLCFRPPADAPDVGPPPVQRTGRITFGSFNNLLKTTPGVVAAWSEILGAVPNSRLLLKAFLLRGPPEQQRLRDDFAGCGIAPDRIELRGGTNDRASHFAAYGEIDIALDTFPYNGTATTCEALWMGLPVVGLRGDRHSGQVGASLLSRAGLSDLLQFDRQAYIGCAVRLASDPAALAARRATLRGCVAASPLCDGPGFARAFEAGLRRMWVDWCRAGSA